MSDSNQDSSDQQQFEQAKALGASLPPNQLHGILSQILQGKGPQLTPASPGSTVLDPAPAIADMQQIGNNVVRQPTSGWVPPAAPQTQQKPPRTNLQLPQFDQAAMDPALQGQNSDVQKLRDIADKVENQPNRTDLSPLAAYVDHVAGTKFAQSYQAPLSPDQKIQEVAKLRQMAATAGNQYSSEQLKMLLGQQKNESLAVRALATMAGQGDRAESKKSDKLNTQFINFGKDADALTQKRNTVGLIAGTEYKASHVATLLDRFSKGDHLAGPELAELGTSVATMLNGSAGQTAQAQIEHFVPPGMGRSAAAIESYFTNAPKGANQGDWVTRFGQTARALQEQSEGQLKDWTAEVADRNQALYDDSEFRPKIYRMMAHKGFTRAETDKIFSQDNLDEQAVAYKGLQGKGTPGGIYSGQVIPAADLNKARSGGIPENPPPIGPTGKPFDKKLYRQASDKAKMKAWELYSKTQPAGKE